MLLKKPLQVNSTNLKRDGRWVASTKPRKQTQIAVPSAVRVATPTAGKRALCAVPAFFGQGAQISAGSKLFFAHNDFFLRNKPISPERHNRFARGKKFS